MFEFARISEKNSFILDLTNNSLKTIESFKNRSSDFQLSEVFNFPGKNNEYLIRKLILLLNKLNNEEDFILNTESNNFLKHINKLLKEEKIDQEDKVRILFNLVNSYRD